MSSRLFVVMSILPAASAIQADVQSSPWNPWPRVSRPPVPVVNNVAWVRNPIDAFIIAEHESRDLSHRPEAPRHVLLRRAYLDLIGLPPTPDELRRFLADESPDAYESVVDRLLASPRYGERWGQPGVGYPVRARTAKKGILVSSRSATAGFRCSGWRELLHGDTPWNS